MPLPSPDAPGHPVRPTDAATALRVEAGDATPETEAARLLTICNACRYCEGYCAVFPAMTRRLQFPTADVHYLANLCHGCGACLHACPYAAPHEFDVNLPRTLARVRVRSYAAYAWPAAFGRLYERNGVAVALVLAWSLALFVALGLALKGRLWGAVGAANFYAVFPHQLMVWLFAPVFVFSLLALGIGARRFWRDMSDTGAPISWSALGGAAGDALRLRYLDGGHGEGCNEAGDGFTLARRRLHHLTFYGFGLCLAATCVATLYHYGLGWPAPYPLASVPVLLGTAGGIGLVVGPAGLWWLQRRRHPDHGDPTLRPIDTALIALLLASSASGLALLALRSAAAMPLLLALHLGCVMALFAMLPYGKFAHAVYRSAALLKWAIERRQPNPVAAPAD